MKVFITLFWLTSLFFQQANVGWYECYNFKGKVGDKSITLSIQIEDGYFGEVDKKNYNVIGVYKFAQENDPIYLDGILNKESNRVTLFEYVKKERPIFALRSYENPIAKLEFIFTRDLTKGKWISLKSNKKLDLKLRFISSLSDTSENNRFKNIPILQNFSDRNHYFVGVYSKENYSIRAKMSELNIFNQSTGKLIQTIDFESTKFAMGNVSTIIYTNVQYAEDGFFIWKDVGMMGKEIYYDWNSGTEKYELQSNK